MIFEIKDRYTGKTIFSAESENFNSLIKVAINSNANLSSADLSSADLSSADLRSADLSSADLSSADLSSADLRSADLSSADLRSADLSNADLRSADLRSADLRSADLSSADLSNAKLDNDTIIETGESWAEYKMLVVPALLVAGGKELQKVIEESWNCHSWKNCPMAVAFEVRQVSDIPVLYRPRVEQFIKYFDAGLLDKEEIQ